MSRVILDLKAPQARKARRGIPDHKAFRVTPGPRGFKVFRGFKVSKVFLDHRVSRVFRAILGPKGPKVTRAPHPRSLLLSWTLVFP